MPPSTRHDLAQGEQAQMLGALRRAGYGYLLALHVLLLGAAGHTPTKIAASVCCSRSSGYRTVRAYHAGTLGVTFDAAGQLLPMVGTTTQPIREPHARGQGGSRTARSDVPRRITAGVVRRGSRPMTIAQMLHQLVAESLEWPCLMANSIVVMIMAVMLRWRALWPSRWRLRVGSICAMLALLCTVAARWAAMPLDMTMLLSVSMAGLVVVALGCLWTTLWAACSR